MFLESRRSNIDVSQDVEVEAHKKPTHVTLIFTLTFLRNKRVLQVN